MAKKDPVGLFGPYRKSSRGLQVEVVVQEGVQAFCFHLGGDRKEGCLFADPPWLVVGGLKDLSDVLQRPRQGTVNRLLGSRKMDSCIWELQPALDHGPFI